ncbi:MAG: hypothetical protein ACK58N_17380 [Synechocystis sp.]
MSAVNGFNFMERYLSKPTPFMADHWSEILPDWTRPPQAIAICLLRAKVPLDLDGKPQHREKDRLLNEFLAFGNRLVQRDLPISHYVEIISPQDGKPVFSQAGNSHVDLVATVHHCLGFPFIRSPQGCKLLLHPEWRSAVYPGLVITTMPMADASLFFHLDPAENPVFPC